MSGRWTSQGQRASDWMNGAVGPREGAGVAEAGGHRLLNLVKVHEQKRNQDSHGWPRTPFSQLLSLGGALTPRNEARCPTLRPQGCSFQPGPGKGPALKVGTSVNIHDMARRAAAAWPGETGGGVPIRGKGKGSPGVSSSGSAASTQEECEVSSFLGPATRVRTTAAAASAPRQPRTDSAWQRHQLGPRSPGSRLSAPRRPQLCGAAKQEGAPPVTVATPLCGREATRGRGGPAR